MTCSRHAEWPAKPWPHTLLFARSKKCGGVSKGKQAWQGRLRCEAVDDCEKLLYKTAT